METEPEITNKNAEKSWTDPITGKFVEGNPGGGRPKGSRDFATDFDEVVEEIAKDNNMTKSEARKLLLKVAYKHAKEGNYSFWKDIHDRIYGTALQRNDLNIEVNGVEINVRK